MTQFSNQPLSILIGGRSPEYPASLESFRHVFDAITQQDEIRLSKIIYLDRRNFASIHKYERGTNADDYILSRGEEPFADIIPILRADGSYLLNLLHGNMGEDGYIQGLAAYGGLEGTFGDVLPPSLSMSKYHMAHYVASAHPSLSIPRTVAIRDALVDDASMIVEAKFAGQRVVIKPNSLGASIYTEMFEINEATMPSVQTTLEAIFRFDRLALAQQFVAGTEYSVGCVRVDDEVVVLPPVHIGTARGFFGHSEKHEAGLVTETVVEANSPTLRHLVEVSRDIFEEVGFLHMCRFDFIVTAKDDYFFLEANPIPGLMKNSIFPRMLGAQGMSISSLLSAFMRSPTRTQKEAKFDYIIA